MFEFKAGDKVVIDNNHFEIYEFIEYNPHYEGVCDLRKDKITTTRLYCNRICKYKTPHEELLDLGWDVQETKFLYTYTKIIDNNEIRIYIHKVKKVYSYEQGRLNEFEIDLQLSRVLTRYLEVIDYALV